LTNTLLRFALACAALLLAALPAAAANRLAQSDSPYLRPHADNPVDWYPWGDAAFAKARAAGKPVFLSIGYSSCYWCRVAEETLYRDPAIAARMNAGFINIKVDREQRPDVDRLYMAATRLLTGSGGWPNNLFLTPERKPFFAGSYFPPADDEQGRPGFVTIMNRVVAGWATRRAEIEAHAESVAAALQRQQQAPAATVAAPAPAQWREAARQKLLQQEDVRYGGLNNRGIAKFPQVPELELLRGDPRGSKLVDRALDAMATAALRDHLGGGFHRYTVDPAWNQPHFEKMLYDNALLLRLYASAGRSTLHRATARETAAFMLGELQDRSGGFYASLDAVASGREGGFYLWHEAQLRSLLGPQAQRFLGVYQLVQMPVHVDDPDVAIDGPQTALRLRAPAHPASLAAARATLLRERAKRPRPARDEKIIVAWNGLAIEALAVAAGPLKDAALLRAAERAAQRLWRDAWEAKSGRLRQALFEGRPQGEGFLEDYALFGNALLALETASGEKRWGQRAADIATAMLQRFARADGGLAATRHAAELFAPADETGDGPYAAGTSAAYALLTRLAARDATRFQAPAERLLAALTPRIAPAPENWPALLAALPARSDAPMPGEGSAGVVTLAPAARWQGQRLTVSLRIAPGWHVNANPASFDYLIPTRLEFAGAAPGAVHYPKAESFRAAFARAELAVYAGAVNIVATFADGRRPQQAWLHVQACSDEICLPPDRIEIVLPAALH
jgi:uncharacterized protein YyaL (SSP411 family)